MSLEALPGPRFASLAEVDRWSRDMTEKFIECRDTGHLWRAHTARFDAEDNTYLRIHRCRRCRTDREQRLSLRGLIESTQYFYPDGYQAPAGFGRLDQEGRGILRLNATLRLIPEDDQPAITPRRSRRKSA